MPYIEPKLRPAIINAVDMLISQIEIENAPERKDQSEAMTVGELNYLITRMVHIWCAHHGVSYANLSAARGVLRDAHDEFYRKVMAPYEDKKIDENGAVGILDVPPQKKT